MSTAAPAEPPILIKPADMGVPRCIRSLAPPQGLGREIWPRLSAHLIGSESAEPEYTDCSESPVVAFN